LTTKLHAVCDGGGRPIRLALTEGQTSDYKGAAMLVDTLPPAATMLADRGYDARWFRDALAQRGIASCIPSQRTRKVQQPYDRRLYQKRHKVENMFARLKDWRRIHTRYDRCAHAFLSAIAFAASFIFWLNQ
jgi:transposase